MISISQQRRSSLADDMEKFLELGKQNNDVITQKMRSSLIEILYSAVKTQIDQMTGNVTGTAIATGADIFDGIVKMCAKKPELINSPNLSNIDYKIKDLEQRFAIAKEKIQTFSAEQLFDTMEFLNENGLEAALDFVLGS